MPPISPPVNVDYIFRKRVGRNSNTWEEWYTQLPGLENELAVFHWNGQYEINLQNSGYNCLCCKHPILLLKKPDLESAMATALKITSIVQGMDARHDNWWKFLESLHRGQKLDEVEA